MSDRISIDYSNSLGAIPDAAWNDSLHRVRAAQDMLNDRSGPGSEFLGWLDLPVQPADAIAGVREAAEQIRAASDTLVVIGIGGSYLGAKAVIDALRPPFAGGLEVVYAGHHIDGSYLRALLEHLSDRSVSINVISKSGTTTEPALAFRLLRQWLEQRYGREEAARRIVATTDASRGALYSVALREKYRTFVIPDDVGGRFSVLTPVGLLPIAAAGIDVTALLEGAASMRERVSDTDPTRNPALCYALLRDALYNQGKRIEVLASFVSALASVAEWWKQLFGESEGKHWKGIFPTAVNNTTDLHSMGQYIQDGERMLFETFVTTAADVKDIEVPASTDDTDGMNFVSGVPFHEVNRNALIGAALAHLHGGVPNSTIQLPDLGPRSIGALLYMFEIAVSYSGYVLGVNPFDQPGVEDYKKNMFALLGKPGFENRRAELEQHRSERGRGVCI